MRGDLTVRINDGERDRHVTGAVRDLRFRKTAPGGHHSASMRLVLPRGTFRDLGPADKLFIYDGATARTIWEGYTENPGVTDGPLGEEYDLSAMGGMILASDESRALFYVARDLQPWQRSGITEIPASAKTEVTPDPRNLDGDGLITQFAPGSPVGTGNRAQMAFLLGDTDMTLGAFATSFKGGKEDANYGVRYATSGGATAAANAALAPSATLFTGSTAVGRWVGTDFAADRDTLAFYLERLGGATNIADDTTWAFFFDLAVAGRRMDRYGNLLTGSAGMKATSNVLASWVVEDLLGRMLTTCDPTSATVDTTSFYIDQLAYFDGVTAQGILDDLALHEPDFLWEILASNSTGKHRFNYRKWPTTPRYEISVKDGYSAPGGDVDLCNRITVYWTDAKGGKRSTVVTQTVEALGSRIKDADPIELPEGFGSASNATRIGQQALAAKANPPKAATATVSRRIVDHLTNATVMPWEIEPGYVVRVRETGDDLRLTEMEYVDSEGAATLTLGEPTLTIEQRIARLANRR